MRQPIVLQPGKPQPTEYDLKFELITTYLEKYAAIGNRALTKATYLAYVEALEDLTLQQIRKGLQECLRDVESFPWPGTVRRYCEEEI